MNTLIQDLRYAVRTMSKTPVFLAVTVLTLALGIGANVAIFTLVNAVLLHSLPFRDPERLVRVFDDFSGSGAKNVGMSVPELEDLRRQSGVFEQISAIWPVSTALSGGDRVERIELLGTNPSYFELLGAKAALGRVFGQADWVPGFLDGVVISDGLWKRQFGGDRQVIGRRIRVDEDGYTIIGVMPPDFRHPGETLDGDVELWAAAGFVGPPAPTPPIRGLRLFPGAMGRLKQGLTLEQAQRRLDAFVARLQQTYPKDYPKQLRWSIRIERAQSSLTGRARPTLEVLLAAVSFVLLMVCVNVASLLIARSSARMREFAIRQALGASRGRLMRQLLTESVMLSLAGGVAALFVLRFAQTPLLAMLPAEVPRLSEVHFDWRMTAVALLLSGITGVLFGLTPALQASAIDPNRDLKEGGRTGGGQSIRQNRSRAALVVLEVALSVVLLVSAGLLIRSFVTLLRQEPGLDPRGLTVGKIWIPVPNNPKANRYLNAAQRAQLAREVLRQVSTLAGVSKAAIATSADVPFLNNERISLPFAFPDEATGRQNDLAVEFGAVSPGYFDTLGTPAKQGRVFTEFDSEKAKRVVVVNEAFVRAFSSHKDPIGRRLRDGFGNESEIVGVVGNVRDEALEVPPSAKVYASIFQSSTSSLAVFLRTRSDILTVKEKLTQTVNGIDPELPVHSVRTMEELMSASMARRRFSLLLMSVFAAVAVMLAALGIYGVMAYLVSQRVQEFGIRSALGARPSDILMLAFRPGLALTGIGIIAGLAASLAVTRLLDSLLFGVSALDPVIFAVVPLVLLMVALAACMIPAGRAVRVSPVEALRY